MYKVILMKNLIKKAIKLKLWSTFDVQFANMLTISLLKSINTKKNVYEALTLASACLSANISYGHTCLPIRFLTVSKLFQGNHPELTHEIYKKLGKLSINNWQELLLSTSIVSDGSYPAPLILENKNLYLHRMWTNECTIAKFFNRPQNSYSLSKKNIVTVLHQLFPAISTDIDWAKIATTMSLINQRVLISGGPGTGKTFTIAKIVTSLLFLYHNKLRIRMAAPTGKSAANLTESLNLTKHNNVLQSNYQHEYTLPIRATTLHKLINTQLYYKKNTQWNYLNNLLPVDLVIIDEASMIGSSILAQLIEILPIHSRIILVGDHNQLCSVEPGSVFKDICQNNININYSSKRRQELMELTNYILPELNNNTINTSSTLYNSIIDNICVLKKNYRFNEHSGIHQLSIAINSGNADHALSILNSCMYVDINYIYLKKKQDYINMITNCATQYHNYLQRLQCNKISKIDILKTFNKYRILCALRDGPFGVIKINRYIEQILNQKGLIRTNLSDTYYIGKPIIILRNEPSLQLSNGDVGILLLDFQDKLSAYFFCPKNIIKIIPICQLPKHETCFAITIHKSQGSEFQQTSIILPNQHTSILTRELLYTAVTRARQNLTLYATNHVITSSIHLITKRYSGLHKKLKNYIKK